MYHATICFSGDLRIGFRSIAGSGTVDCPDKHYLPTAESCISVPTCSDHVPDFAYDPMSNSCRDLDGEISLQDLQQLPSIDPDSSWSSQDYVNLQVTVSQDCINQQVTVSHDYINLQVTVSQDYVNLQVTVSQDYVNLQVTVSQDYINQLRFFIRPLPGTYDS
uniref:Uncharacterized protein n=1 Tax=Timema poppense TaxID=170557 RepID=A0A7R9DL50_TIMPO|nr:unnamed protein product [Timema poppensis]